MRSAFDRLRYAVQAAAADLDGDGDKDAARYAKNLRTAFEAVEQSLSAEQIFEAVYPESSTLYAETDPLNQQRYERASQLLRGRSTDWIEGWNEGRNTHGRG